MKNLWYAEVSKLDFKEWYKCFSLFLDDNDVEDFNELLLCYVAQRK